MKLKTLRDAKTSARFTYLTSLFDAEHVDVYFDNKYQFKIHLSQLQQFKLHILNHYEKKRL